jgi:hypothetical protein
MADVVPNYPLEKMGLDLEKSQLLLNIQSNEFRIAQSQDEIRRISENIVATKTAIAAIDEKLVSFNKGVVNG